jgi:nucleotide-binding universal stress UspA family protein
MKVIIGIDDSPQSNAAVEMAKTMTWPLGTRFIVLSAVRIELGAHSLADTGGATVIQEIQERQTKAHQELAARVERDLKAAGLLTTGRVETGDPRDVLVHVAENERADLVIVGSHGRTGLAKMLLGSVASHVVTHAPCGVWVVKQPRVSGGTGPKT